MDGPCSRCLIHLNASIAIFEKTTGKAMPSSSPRAIIAWYESVMEETGGDAWFTWNSSDRVLVPVSTWHGDPVCEAHLWELRDRELRGGR